MLVKGDARQALVVGPRRVQEWSPTGKKARFGVAVTIVGAPSSWREGRLRAGGEPATGRA